MKYKYLTLLTVLVLFGCENKSQQSATDTQNTTAEQELQSSKHCTDGKPKAELVQSATAGDANAQLTIAGMYDVGSCGTSDLTLAEEWYLKSANQNNTHAQMALGSLYASDEYHQKYGKWELEKAIHWITKASEQNNDVAMLYLGAIYYEDKYQINDMAKAKHWFEQSAQLGNKQAVQILSEIK